MNQAVLLLGGNLGDRKAIISEANRLINESCGGIIKQSKIYESEAWGFETENNFFNQAILIESKYNAKYLLELTQNIEIQLGRKQKTSTNYVSRPIDIDILFYNSDIIETDKLTIPHPRLHLRKFTLECLMDLNPSYIHPVLKNSISELLKQCVDNVKVWPYE